MTERVVEDQLECRQSPPPPVQQELVVVAVDRNQQRLVLHARLGLAFEFHRVEDLGEQRHRGFGQIVVFQFFLGGERRRLVGRHVLWLGDYHSRLDLANLDAGFRLRLPRLLARGRRGGFGRLVGGRVGFGGGGRRGHGRLGRLRLRRGGWRVRLRRHFGLGLGDFLAGLPDLQHHDLLAEPPEIVGLFLDHLVLEFVCIDAEFLRGDLQRGLHGLALETLLAHDFLPRLPRWPRFPRPFPLLGPAGRSSVRFTYTCCAIPRMLLVVQYSTSPLGTEMNRAVNRIGISLIIRAWAGFIPEVGVIRCWTSIEPPISRGST